MIPFVFFTVFAALSGVYALFLLRVRSGARFYETRNAEWRADFAAREVSSVPVTVIVAMRDEEHCAAACIRSLHAQTYPAERTQVIVVDDHSSDGTAAAVMDAAGDDPRFVLLRLDDAAGVSGKKSAVEAAIAHATGETVLTTDADCVHGADWISSMQWLLARGNDIVGGPVLYERGNGLFARLQALEFLGIMGVTAGLFGIGYPRLCNGANLAYRRDAFRRVDGFGGHRHLASGEDEFLLQAIVYRAGGAAEFNPLPESAVVTPGARTLRAFLSQRARWASKGGRYEDGRFVAFLVLLYAYFLGCSLAPLAALSSPAALLAAFLLLLVKWTLDLSVLVPAARLLGAPVRLTDFVIAELLHPVYLVAVSTAGAFGRFAWKGRTTTTARARSQPSG
ncbi:MAG: glycosyltransferase [Ignavibacteria bacterium]|nr:glycosyltransferase [Ignavibacteria bacterium]